MIQTPESQPFIDRVRAARLMQEAGLDALVLLQPENIQYAVGAGPGVAALFRRAGAGIAVIPADVTVAPGAVMPDLVASGVAITDVRHLPIWVGTTELDSEARADAPLADRLTDRTRAPERPSTFDQHAAFAMLADLLSERGLASARLGMEFEFLSVTDFAALRKALPKTELKDSSHVIRRLRMVKSEREIRLLHQACALAEHGVNVLLPEIRAGMARDRMAEIFLSAVRTQGRALQVTNLTAIWEYISVGARPWGAPKDAAPGDIIKIDIGAVLSGYSSDSARTYVLGKADPDQARVHAGLLAGFEAGISMLGPGVRLADVHTRMIGAIRKAGLPGYRRGHFGHGLGQSLFSEEWPFFAADSAETLEPGMVMALEAPYYIDGLGGFIVEDQVLITTDGAESMNTLPHDLLEIG